MCGHRSCPCNFKTTTSDAVSRPNILNTFAKVPSAFAPHTLNLILNAKQKRKFFVGYWVAPKNSSFLSVDAVLQPPPPPLGWKLSASADSRVSRLIGDVVFKKVIFTQKFILTMLQTFFALTFCRILREYFHVLHSSISRIHIVDQVVVPAKNPQSWTSKIPNMQCNNYGKEGATGAFTRAYFT